MAEKVTFMKLKVDLECGKCCKKVKKVLSKYPQIRDQKFDEKQNIVIITVVCCSPEKIRDKLCCKSGGSIKSIEIVEPAKPEKKKEDDKPKPVDSAKPTEKKTEAGKPKSDAPKNDSAKPTEKKIEAEKSKSEAPKKDGEKPKEKPSEPKSALVAPMPRIFDHVSAYPPPPIGMYCVPAYEGRPVGPYINEYGGPPPCYGGYYGRPIYDSYGGGGAYYSSGRDQYSQECTIM
ncbi:putative heavy metal-associated domain, HMA [Lupinus albus]|uniref:Putative heavy metal-associated domain, HMA n=1 Tax=Lupinus albus TaxID=3870 RepID=A0A6A4PB47_LUPAL|nr:putative heavy metal-associated domain, HMA [Lupinus albus]